MKTAAKLQGNNDRPLDLALRSRWFAGNAAGSPATALATMRAIRRIGKTESKFVFSVHVCDVRGLPAGVSTVSLSWQRGDRVVNTPSVLAQGSGGERGARIDVKLTHVATLYASKDHQFDPKPSSLRVLHTPTAGAKPVVLAVAELDLAEYVPSPAEGAARPRQIVKQVLLSPG